LRTLSSAVSRSLLSRAMAASICARAVYDALKVCIRSNCEWHKPDKRATAH
jgi:hypothetical protein